ncbi:MAG: hypothetical protein ACXVBE_09300 [Bdellovibrionota bacterium]
MPMIFPSRFNDSESGLGLISVVFLLATLTLAVSVAVISVQPTNSADAAAKTMSKMDVIGAAIVRYRSYSGTNPASVDALVTPPSPPTPPCTADVNPASPTFRQLRGWCGPHLDVDIASSYKSDGWGVALVYNGTNLRSCGPNRICGDGDDIVTTP